VLQSQCLHHLSVEEALLLLGGIQAVFERLYEHARSIREPVGCGKGGHLEVV
jgi:hypothetical protein